MKIQHNTLNSISITIYGETSEKVYLYLHGQNGNQEEAAFAAKILTTKGWQVVAYDLPEHGTRKNSSEKFVPWEVIPELKNLYQTLKQNWTTIALYANSISAWFSLLAFADIELDHCLLVSPVVDMEKLITKMMSWAQVSEVQLEQEQLIETDFGQTLSWQYLTYTRTHPVTNWQIPTKIMFGENDNLTSLAEIRTFAEKYHCQLTVMPGGEHWFHTEEQLQFLSTWLNKA
ncbi:alpha/beta hydrolase [Enterococcus alishanensis]|uniref:Alpha/beta hydrolase n=1 Tax=Enterococcus alishanensis TaxID=1303817 RepID=A0ABS6TCI5_9ENTE|nr:alpha/beta hydrolase [Enterococcus alishanensis]MBV7390614.1 alpha/beta hydrolase [Enterococcus alishanensis]